MPRVSCLTFKVISSIVFIALSGAACGAKQPKVSNTLAADPSNYHARPNSPCQECHGSENPHTPPRGPCGTCHSYPDWSKIK